MSLALLSVKHLGSTMSLVLLSVKHLGSTMSATDFIRLKERQNESYLGVIIDI